MQDGKPGKREDDRTKNTDDEDGASGTLRCAVDRVQVLLWRVRVIADGEEMALGDCFR